MSELKSESHSLAVIVAGNLWSQPQFWRQSAAQPAVRADAWTTSGCDCGPRTTSTSTSYPCSRSCALSKGVASVKIIPPCFILIYLPFKCIQSACGMQPALVLIYLLLPLQWQPGSGNGNLKGLEKRPESGPGPDWPLTRLHMLPWLLGWSLGSVTLLNPSWSSFLWGFALAEFSIWKMRSQFASHMGIVPGGLGPCSVLAFEAPSPAKGVTGSTLFVAFWISEEHNLNTGRIRIIDALPGHARPQVCNYNGGDGGLGCPQKQASSISPPPPPQHIDSWRGAPSPEPELKLKPEPEPGIRRNVPWANDIQPRGDGNGDGNGGWGTEIIKCAAATTINLGSIAGWHAIPGQAPTSPSWFLSQLKSRWAGCRSPTREFGGRGGYLAACTAFAN